MGASEQRIRDKIYLEPKVFRSGEAGAKTWVHFDVTAFSNKYLNNNLFKQKVESLNGVKLLTLIKENSLNSILNCSGQIPTNNKLSVETTGTVLELTKQDLDDLLKAAATEVHIFKNNEDMTYQQMGGVVETMLNRRMTGRNKWSTIRKVLNEQWAFSDINSTRPTAYGSVQNVPWSRVTDAHRKAFNKYINDRVNGKPSIIGSELNYANPTQLQEASQSTKKWVADVVNQAKKTGYIFGRGDFIHYHGTTSDMKPHKPASFKIKIVN